MRLGRLCSLLTLDRPPPGIQYDTTESEGPEGIEAKQSGVNTDVLISLFGEQKVYLSDTSA